MAVLMDGHIFFSFRHEMCDVFCIFDHSKIDTMKKIIATLFTAVLVCAPSLRGEVKISNPDQFPEPVPLSSERLDEIGRMMPRTVHLLESSTPQNRKKVKIAIYGQSLSDRNNFWWGYLDKALKEAYPNADIDVNCLGVGGFSTATLWRLVDQDIAAYYPDLVILCVTGNHYYYESILRQIRGCTTAEVLIQTDHIRGRVGSGEGCDWDCDIYDMTDWGNKMSLQTIPQYCKTYGLERNNRIKEWYDYLKANCYHPMSGVLLQSDSTHFGPHAEYLTAALTARHFRYHKEADPDPYRMVTVYKVGEDVKVAKNTIKLFFEGNRVDVITEDGDGKEAIQVLIDREKPSAFPGCYKNTRTATNGDFWQGGAVQTFGSSVNLREEDWILKIDDDGNYTLNGSLTGFDGKGSISERFESNSGRAVIRSEDWFKGRSEFKDRELYFQTKLFAFDNYLLPATQSANAENAVTLAQGFPNGTHELTLTGAVKKIKEIRVYRPPYCLSLSANTDMNTLRYTSAGGEKPVVVFTNTYWQVGEKPDWITLDAIDNNEGEALADSKTIAVSVQENKTGKFRLGTITLTGKGVEPLVLTIAQE